MHNSIFFICLLIFLSACGLEKKSNRSNLGYEVIEPEGERISKNVYVDMFRFLEVDLNSNIHLIQSDSLLVSIDGFKNILDLIDIRVSNSKMTIKFKKYITHKTDLCIKIYVPAIQFILMNGTGSFKINSWENEDRLHFKNNGSANFLLENIKHVKHLVVELNGEGTFESKGESDKINSIHCFLNGSGNINLEQFNSISTNVELNGSGNISLGNTESLNVSQVGSGNISYLGFPKIHQKNIGSGTLNQK